MKIDKAYKNLDVETLKDLEGSDTEELKKRIVQSTQAIQSAEEELEANPDFQELKESLKAVTAGFKEVKTRQNSIVAVCLHVLSSKGK